MSSMAVILGEVPNRVRRIHQSPVFRSRFLAVHRMGREPPPPMTTAADHYDGFLAEHYTWMLGGDLASLARAQRTQLSDWGVVPAVPDPHAGSVAVDLGCGPGHTSLALAGLGFDLVHAVDLSQSLLDEL